MVSETSSGRSLLCVQDRKEDLDLFKAIFDGQEVVFASTALDAIRHLNTRAFDGYILEFWLPDWYGPALCKEIRKLDPYGPIIFCSAAAGEPERKRALRAGATTYLVKPVDPNELLCQTTALLKLAELESLHARPELDRAIASEVERTAAFAQDAQQRERLLKSAALERVAKRRAFEAFVKHRGSSAHFERWWPQSFAAVRDAALSGSQPRPVKYVSQQTDAAPLKAHTTSFAK